MNFSDLGKMKEMMAQAREMQAQMEQKLVLTPPPSPKPAAAW